MMEKIDNNFSFLNSKMDENNFKVTNLLKDTNLKLQVCRDSLDNFAVKNKQLTVRTEELDNNQKSIQAKNEKLALKITKQDNLIKEKSDSLKNEMNEINLKAQNNFRKNYDNILKTIESSKEEMKKVVEHSEEFT